MAFDFHNAVDRRGTGSEKWDKYAGTDVLPMWVADMEFASPPAIIEALRRRAELGNFGYACPRESLVETVCGMCRERYGWAVEPDWLVWLPGLVSALNVVCRMAGQPGDEVMTSTPVYPPFLTAPGNMEREVVEVPLLCREGRWQMNWDGLEASVTPRTKLFLLCHPHNPVGSVFPPAEIRRLVEFCQRHDLILCSDEIHCDLILEDVPHRPAVMEHPDAGERVITLMAPSKTFNVPGLGCAMAIIPDAKLRRAYQRAANGIVPHVGIFGYEGCEAAYRHGEPWRRELIECLRGNRDLVWDFVRREMPAIRTTRVEATYLAWLDVSGLGVEEPVTFFEKAGVGLSDGRFFRGEGFLRLNFGCPEWMLQKALDRMRAGVDSLLKPV